MFDLIIRIIITIALVLFGVSMITLFVVMVKLAIEDRKKQKEEEE